MRDTIYTYRVRAAAGRVETEIRDERDEPAGEPAPERETVAIGSGR